MGLVKAVSEGPARFISDGFIIIRNAIPPTLVDAALGHVNAALVSPGSVAKDEDGTLQICQEARSV